ncbi:MAG: type IV toxin-antitoxin system AbiEi family antitoxin [Candidatus Caldatribacteriota bacterium]|nr:type IV toxin-antitoxin system AbiEi family antitoxin [Candidatus Caldatribacteriota bacterium]
MVTEKEIIESIKKNIQNLFESTDFIKVNSIKSEVKNLFPDQQFQPDLIVEVKTKDKKKYFVVFEVKSAGQPRYVRMAVSKLKYMVSNKKNYYGVFAATFISKESKQICNESGVGFIDLAGNCLFKFDNVYINIEGCPNIFPNTRPLKSIFSPKSTRALRIFLCNPKKEWFVKDIAKEAKISLGQASNIKQRLLEYEFVETTGIGKNLKIRLNKAESLLKEWSKNYTYQRNKIRNFYSMDKVEVLEKKIVNYFKDNQVTYAFTLTSGASRVAPFLRYNRIFTYVSNNIDLIAKDLNFKEVSTGPNISFLDPYDEGILYYLQEINGVKVVSDIQLYLDLKRYLKRGEEAAEFLLEKRLKKQW